MDLYLPTPTKELSRRRLEEYDIFCKVIKAGRRNPIWFMEDCFGIKMMDDQKWAIMSSWDKPFVLWLECRAGGKSTKLGCYMMGRQFLIPNCKYFISANSAQQSFETYKTIESIALKRVPSFKTVNDIFAMELERQKSTDTGFYHNPAGYIYQLYNGSMTQTLSANTITIRGKRGNVIYDEAAWQTYEQMSATEHFTDLDTDFSLGTGSVKYAEPSQLPLQLIYASSAGDVGTPFHDKFVYFTKRMLIGDKNYFVCDIDVNTRISYSFVDGEKIKSHISEDKVQKAIEEDPEAAERELFNHFRKGGGTNAIVKADTLLRNSKVRLPVLYNDTGKRKFLFTYDPARNYDGSVLSIWEWVYDESSGWHLEIANCVSMVDEQTKNKTPLPTPEQIKIIRALMLQYNGEKAAEWENIEFAIDSGSGGGGISAIADNLMLPWTDDLGITHRGIIDPVHKQYETARTTYPNDADIVTLVDPQPYKKVAFDSLANLLKLNLIEFTEYDGKDEMLLDNGTSEYETRKLTFDEKMALRQVQLMKNELLYICRYDSGNTVSYDLAKEKKNKMHDDRAYTAALAAFMLDRKRRSDVVLPKTKDLTVTDFVMFKKPCMKL